MTRNDISDLDGARTSKTRSNTLSERLPNVAEELKQAHVALVSIAYDHGSVGDPRYYTAQRTLVRPGLSATFQSELLSFFKQLLELRYPGWAHVQGVDGVFEWDVALDTLTHTHGVTLWDYEVNVTVLEGL